MPNIVDDAVRAALDALFLPARHVTTQRLSRITLALIVLILVSTVALAMPVVRDWVAGTFLEKPCMSAMLKEAGKQYCDFAIILFQLMIAFVIGGIFITDDIVARIQRGVHFAETKGSELTEEQEMEIRRGIEHSVRDVQAAWAEFTIWNLHHAVWVTYRRVNKIFNILFWRMPGFFGLLLTFRVLASFPKGFYGVLALALFEGTLVAQTLKTYYEYLPSCP